MLIKLKDCGIGIWFNFNYISYILEQTVVHTFLGCRGYTGVPRVIKSNDRLFVSDRGIR